MSGRPWIGSTSTAVLGGASRRYGASASVMGARHGNGSIIGKNRPARSVPEHGDAGVDEREDADEPEQHRGDASRLALLREADPEERSESTRLNSSHVKISY